jgi:signal transduction histidine kinase
MARGTFEPDRAEVDLDSLIEAVTSDVSEEAAQREVEFRSDSGPTGVRFPGDPRRIVRVFKGLASKAIKETPVGGVVHMTGQVARRRAVLELTGEGEALIEGSPPAPFERVRRSEGHSSRHSSNLDFDLAYARAVVEWLGGRATAANTAGGVSFTFQFPLKKFR